MKFYLETVQFNKIAEAENRQAAKKFETLEEAEAEFHTQVGKDMKNGILGGSLNFVYNSEGGMYPDLNKKWGFMEKEPEEPKAETPAPDEEASEPVQVDVM